MRALLDLIYPAACATCHGEIAPGEAAICWDCLRSIHLIEAPFCKHCGHPVSGAVTHAYTCQQCTDVQPHFDSARAVGRFDGALREAILGLKYRRAVWLEPMLSDLLEQAARHQNLDQIDLICSVPLHRWRRWRRGFNQSELLARGLSKRLKIPYIKCLHRIKPTPTQTSLSKSARRENVHGAFRACKTNLLTDKTVLLLDDVKTSGATVSECSRILKRAGTSRVDVLTLAHG